MCGIAGIVAHGGAAGAAPPADPGELERMTRRLAPRGPDGEGRWCSADGRVALAHRRLAVIDPGPGGAQPMRFADGRYVITCNGEIYNYRELRRDLAARGVRLRTDSDIEVILALFAEQGPAMLTRLRGMFALAIWDDQARTLFAARDAFGIKPLYWSDDGTTLRFASTVKALVAGGGVDTAPDPAGKVGFLTLGYVPDPHTMLASVRALPAGTHLTLGPDGRPRLRRWYDLAERLRAVPDTGVGRDRVGRLRAALDDSVRHHLVSDVPVGAFLSAGRDSTTLVACARRVGAGRIRTVTLGFDGLAGGPGDETGPAAAAARAYGTEHRCVTIGRRDFEADRERLLDAMDQPTTDGVNTWFVARATAASDLKVALSGLGADEWLGGYPSFRQIPALVGTAAALPGSRGVGTALRALLAPVLSAGVLPVSPKAAGLLEYGTTAADAWLLRRALFMPWELPRLMDRDEAAAGWAALDLRARLAATAGRQPGWRSRIAALEAAWYMSGQLLRDADWAGMAHGLEIRVPFVDTVLLEALAPMLAGGDPPTKADLPLVAGPDYPPALAGRAKTGFAVPVREWIGGRAGRGLRGWARTVLARWEADMRRPLL